MFADRTISWPGLSEQGKRQMRTLFLGSGIGLAGGFAVVVLSNFTSPLATLLAAAGGIVVLGILLLPAFGFLMVCAVIPLERIARLTDDFNTNTISLMRILGVVALCSFLLHAAMKKWKLKFGTACLLYTGYCLIGALTIFYAEDQPSAIRDTGRIIGNLMFLFLVINVVRNFKLAKAGTLLWMAVTVGTCVFSIYEYRFAQSPKVMEKNLGVTDSRVVGILEDESEYNSLNKAVQRAVGTTSHPTIFGVNLCLSLPFFAYLFRIGNWRWKLAALAGALLVLYNILLANTRAVILLAGFIVLYCLIRGLIVITPGSLVTLVLATAVIVPYIPSDVYERVLDTSNYTVHKSETFRIRLKYWGIAWDIFEENWIGGIGVGNQTAVQEHVHDELAGRDTPVGRLASAHNEYLQTLDEVGLFGSILHWAFVGFVTWCSFRAASIFRRLPGSRDQYWFLIACQATMLGILFFGVQVDVFHFSLKGWWLAASLSWVLLELAKKQEKAVQIGAVAAA